MGTFTNKKAVITGAARGIGKTAARCFLEQGATVTIWDVDAAAGAAALAELRASSEEVFFVHVNVTDFASVTAAVQATTDYMGGIDILINNAGITRDMTLLKMTPEQWQQVIDVNLTGVFNCTKAIAPLMVERGHGRIINTSSVVGLYGNFGQTNYVATKSGVIGMTKVWARELGKKGITVNAVAPGFIATEMIATVPEKVITMLMEKTPAGRLGKPEDIAHAFLYLASDAASFVNGTVLSVDGGLVM